MQLPVNFETIVSEWKNEDAHNNALHAACAVMVDATPILKSHRDWVEEHQHGFGDRSFHWIWHLLVGQMPTTFSFLEVGVYKGQVLSLIDLLAIETLRRAVVVGVTTLTNTEDEKCRYPQGDYLGWIKEIYAAFGMSQLQPILIEGKSTDPTVIEKARGMHGFNIVYVDGGHDYPDAFADLTTYPEMVILGGYLVIDDASGSEDKSFHRLNIGSCWPGFAAVARAVSETIDKDLRFKFLFAVGHLNVFQRVAL